MCRFKYFVKFLLFVNLGELNQIIIIFFWIVRELYLKKNNNKKTEMFFCDSSKKKNQFCVIVIRLRYQRNESENTCLMAVPYVQIFCR